MTNFKRSPFRTVVQAAMHWNVHVERERNELEDRADQRRTGTGPRHQVRAIRAAHERDFFVHTLPGLRGSLSGVPEGGAMWIAVLLPRHFVLDLRGCPWTFGLEVPQAFLSQTR